MPILVLPDEVAAKIAAGEVVERPASVVKELVENAIDAGAKTIKVEMRQGGRQMMRVADDGTGIPATEVELAFARHSTSKLKSAADLNHIATLGFRGEALASIAAVAQVTVLTRTQDEGKGTLIAVRGGKVVRRESRGAPQGTIVTVENLFYNVPARLKFLRQPTTEAGHIGDLVTHYALACPQLRFQLVKDGRLSFQSTGSGKLSDVLIKVYGLETARQMLSVASDEQRSVQVDGYVSPPALHRSGRGYLTFFVNRRWVQDRLLSKAVLEAYHTLLPKDRYPLVILNVGVDYDQVDVNVHPTKSEIRFLKPNDVFSAVQRTVRRALTEGAPIPIVSVSTTRPETARFRDFERGPESPGGKLALELQRTADTLAPQPLPTKLPMLRVLGQIGQTYIIAEGPDGVYLIDQHAAHERVLFERIKAERAQRSVSGQQLLTPLTLDLPPRQAAILSSRLEELAALGFEIEPFGGETFLVRAVPAMLVEGDVAQTVADLADELAEGGEVEAIEEKALITLVCHSAVRAGKTLSLEEMRGLIRQLEETDQPRTCPHGRPTMIHLSADNLARQFGRR